MLRRSTRRQSVAPPRQGPSLLGTMARTAAISSTATATSRAVNQSLDDRANKSQPTPEIATPEPSAQPDLLTQLTQLAELKQTGALTEAEFQLVKAKLLNP